MSISRYFALFSLVCYAKALPLTMQEKQMEIMERNDFKYEYKSMHTRHETLTIGFTKREKSFRTNLRMNVIYIYICFCFVFKQYVFMENLRVAMNSNL